MLSVLDALDRPTILIDHEIVNKTASINVHQISFSLPSLTYPWFMHSGCYLLFSNEILQARGYVQNDPKINRSKMRCYLWKLLLCSPPQTKDQRGVRCQSSWRRQWWCSALWRVSHGAAVPPLGNGWMKACAALWTCQHQHKNGKNIV